MKKVLLFTAVAMILVITAVAQETGVPGSYKLNYYSNRNNSAGADQVVRLINPGTSGTPLSGDEGVICANVYVFDATQEMVECCGCPVTANGILQLSILKDLTQNPLTGFPAPNSGVIKVMSASQAGKTCDPTSDRTVTELLGWMTHIQQPTQGTFVTTEDAFQEAPLNSDEYRVLHTTCAFVLYLGSGKGSCTCGSAS